MSEKDRRLLDYREVELDGVRYVILRQSLFERLCALAGVDYGGTPQAEPSPDAELDLDRASLAQRLVRRRRAVGLSQVELARRAGVRPETLNRIERGHTTPDFATVRKLVVTMNAAAQAAAQQQLTEKEVLDADRA